MNLAKVFKVGKDKFTKLLKVLFCLAVSLVLLTLIYLKSLPQKYDLKVGQISQYDIVATHNLIDHNATRQKAITEAAAISPIFVRSSELSLKALEQLDAYLSLLYTKRLPVWQAYAATVNEPLEPDLDKALAKLTAAAGAKKQTKPTNLNNAPLSSTASTQIVETVGETAATAIAATDKEAAVSNGNAALQAVKAEATTESEAATLSSEELAAKAAALQEQILKTYPGVEDLENLAKEIESASSASGVRLPAIYTALLAEAEPSVFLSLVVELKSTAKNIMSQGLNKENLEIAITRQSNNLVANIKEYAALYGVAAPLYRNLLMPNLRYDAQATQEARNTVYERALQNPIQIHRGTRIVNFNDIITEAQYANLHELNLLKDDKPNWNYLCLLLLMYGFCTLLSLLYLRSQGKNYAADRGSNYILLCSAVLVILVSLYTANWSDFFIPLPFFILISATYFTSRDSMFMSLILLFFLSIFSSNLPAHFIVYSIAILIINLIMYRYKQRSNYLVMIVSACLAMTIAAFFYSFFEFRTIFETFRIVLLCLINGLLSSLAAIGIIPLLDFVFAAVSPMRLVALAQPDAPLMKRMFMEALGTYQHSMMVANLAENAAQAVGANTLLCRVGGYYHDIGKLQAPLMFTENQDAYNPHDDLSPESSYKIITKHVAMGQKIAKRYRLPQALINIIREHHGTTVLFYFYKKAEQEHQQLDMPTVEKGDWQYPWNSPSSREAAIVMLADSVEAAMKSTGYRTIDEMEKLARNIVRDKNSQDQLKNSGLSYQDVEDILEAFKRVYVGVFKERVKYPDVSKS